MVFPLSDGELKFHARLRNLIFKGRLPLFSIRSTEAEEDKYSRRPGRFLYHPGPPRTGSMTGVKKRLIPTSLALVLCCFPAKAIAQQFEAVFEQIDEPHEMAIALFAPASGIRDAALMRIVQRGKPDMAAPLIKVLRLRPRSQDQNPVRVAARDGRGQRREMVDWMLWQQAHPEVKPFDGYDRFQADFFSFIDENFRLFLQPGMKHEIRLEEIVWGGVKKDGIPALTNPKLVAAKEGGLSDRRGFGLRRGNRRGRARLPPSNHGLARNAERHGRGCTGFSRLLHPVRVGHSVRHKDRGQKEALCVRVVRFPLSLKQADV